MKKKMIFLVGIMITIIAASALIIKVISKNAVYNVDNNAKKVQIVASFYPVYMIGLNITDQLEGIEVNSLTDINTGCLHDYQLTTEDMKLISDADILIINGGGMEGFLTDLTANYPNLTIIDASEDIEMLPRQESDLIDPEEHEESNWNAHVWLDPKRYIQQIENVRDGLVSYFNAFGEEEASLVSSVQSNAGAYIDQVASIDQELDQLTAVFSSGDAAVNNNATYDKGQAVIFHDAFAYLANRAGITVKYTVPLDSDTSLSAGDIAQIVRAAKQDGIHYLFTEMQYSTSIAQQIGTETGAKVYIIDSAVTGDGAKDSYIKAMKKNIATLQEAFQ